MRGALNGEEDRPASFSVGLHIIRLDLYGNSAVAPGVTRKGRLGRDTN